MTTYTENAKQNYSLGEKIFFVKRMYETMKMYIDFISCLMILMFTCSDSSVCMCIRD